MRESVHFQDRLEQMLDLISSLYVFDGESYPALKKASPDALKVFSINHSILHMQKSIGRLAEQVESCDHGGMIADDVVRTATIKMLVNTLKLAEVIGMNAIDLHEGVRNLYEEKADKGK